MVALLYVEINKEAARRERERQLETQGEKEKEKAKQTGNVL